MMNLNALAEQFQVIDELTDAATKEQMIECARMLSLHLAHYQLKFGELPLRDELVPTPEAELNDEQLALVLAGMENLLGHLGNVMKDAKGQKR